MRFTCVFTVPSLTNSAAAISALDRPRAISSQHLEFALGQLVESPAVVRRSARGRLANSSIRRRVTSGASSASPAATTRIASMSRPAGRP